MAIDPTLITTASIGELPTAPLSLTSKIAHETVSDGLAKQATIQDLVNLISPLVAAIQYQVITLHVTQEFIDDNFVDSGETKGLGINLMTGYAICNGNNGTINKDGRVGIAYGSTYNVIGAIGGSPDSVLVEHEHKTVSAVTPSGEYNSTNKYTAAFRTSGGDMQYGLQGTASEPSTGFTDKIGVSGVGKNMQPYIVTLVTMKI